MALISSRAIFIQGGSRSHAVKKSVKEIKYQLNFALKDWPGNLPHLNPVRHLWTKLQASVS